ncbi:hypothetical protein IQ37_09405 [Chryseobacterium piperi]|uniref:CCDC81-like prokaryotic HU domain-containing protein n=1 Tax=Chryseobacterium piperi TaxID=558152 RepID=A0A086BII3_9FLAO|nr:hypothetical protein [Chryseobacterium piperi]ASW75569.1 hypothetical protein CJF12_15635 [Chryseobacterium piperi]KFF28747.1 hypothetical protein IQ37_09405 [Chryseobacterium piperi]
MNISAYILEYLKQFGTVTVPAFGVFSLENSKAIINSENGSILPPASQIAFTSDYEVELDELVSFISNQKQISIDSAQNELQIQTDFWKKKLQADQTLEIQNLGTIFIEDGHTFFKGNRLASGHPDFYGLEEIRLSDISNTEKPIGSEKSDKDYKFNKSILWIFLIIIPVLGLIYLAFTQQELLFGKKSFDSVSVKTKTRRIEKTPAKIQIDSAQVKISDSLKKDSLIQSTKKGGIQPSKKQH